MRATATIEAQGVPAVPMIAAGFATMARAVGKALGIAHVPLAVYEGVVMNDTDAEFRRKVADGMVPGIIGGLLDRGHGGDAAMPDDEPDPRDVVFSGDIDAVQDEFCGRGWSDGMPVVPPTVERVARFLEFTDRDPAEVIGVLPSENREATVWSVAVNGVMAGCRPEYMPVLLGIVEVLADPGFRLEDAGSTPGWEPLVIVSGRVVRDLDFNVGTGALRIGRRANSSIGRFLRLYMRNLAGIRIPPGETDLGSIGAPFHVALGEDEAAIEQAGWEPFRVDVGFGREDSVVCVQSVLSMSIPIYSGGTVEEHFATIAGIFRSAMEPWCWLGVEKEQWHPLLIMCPDIALKLARQGATKRDLQQYLYDNLWISAADMERFTDAVGFPGWRLDDLVRRGRIPAEYHDSDDPHRLVRMLRRPEWTRIVVAGSPARNQSRGLVNNHTQGVPTAKVVRLPADWDERLARRSM